jgi:hypothetical protein
MALRTLFQAFLDSDPSRLRVVARQWKLELTASRRTDMAAELVDAMASAEAVGRNIDDLSSEEQAALDDLVRHGGVLPWAVFSRRWGEIRTAGAGRVEREELWRDPVSAAEGLWYRGWVHRAFGERAGRPVEMAFVPEELMLYLPAPPSLEIPAPSEVEPPPYQTLGDDSLADDLVTLWATLQRENSLRDDLPAEPGTPAAQRLFLLETLSVESSWLRRTGQGQLRPVPNAILDWLKSDPWSQWASLGQAWMTSQQWNDLAYVSSLTPDPVNSWPNDPVDARQAFLEVLARCTPGLWYSLEAFAGYIKSYATDFLRPDGNYDSWAPRDARTDAPLRGFSAWDAVEAALIAYYISGPLFWLGLVDLGYVELASSPTAFRLTDAAAALLTQAEPPEVPIAARLRLEPAGEIIVPPRRRYERFQLGRIADAVSAPDEYRYRISPSSLNRAKQQRISNARIIAFLETSIGSANIPSHLVKAIQRTYQGGGSARLTRPWVLHVPDPEILLLLTTHNMIEEQLTADMIVISEENRAQVAQLLLEKGFLIDIFVA